MRNKKEMKSVFKIVFLVCLSILISCKQKSKAPSENIDSSLAADETIHQGVIQMERSEISDTTKWHHRVYQYKIVREPDASLPKIKDSDSKSLYMDNHIMLTISCEGKQLFQKVFTKSDFNSFLDAGFKKNGILEGFVFDKVVPEGLRFATSVSYPQSDLYIPLVVVISSNGTLKISKDDIMDTDSEESTD